MLNVLFLLRIFLRRIYIIKFNETAADTLKKKKKINGEYVTKCLILIFFHSGKCNFNILPERARPKLVIFIIPGNNIS